jgi:hypothetical protein
MRGFPPELVYFLIFAAIFLFQYLMKAARRGANEAEQEMNPPRAPYPTTFESSTLEEIPTTWSAPRVIANDFGRRPAAPAVVRRRPRRRFSRQALFGTRRDVQNAVVIAAILGPCRALEPPGEAPAQPPKRATR